MPHPLSIEVLRKLVRLDSATGELFWLPRPLEMFRDGAYSRERQKKTFDKIYAGKPAFNYIDKEGYRRGAVMGQSIRAHTVVWALTHGDWPTDRIDHKNQVRDVNRPDDLRAANAILNGANSKRRTNNTSGYKGVYWSKAAQKWVAQITINYKTKNLGGYSSPEEAHAVYMRKARQVFGDFASPG